MSGGHSHQVNASFGSLNINGQAVGGSLTSVPIVNYPVTTPASLSATGQFTAAQVLAGIVEFGSAGTASQTLSFPDAYGNATAANNLVANMTSPVVGSSFQVTVVNLAASNAVTVAAGAHGTLVGAASVSGASSGTFRVVITATGTTPTYTMYRI